MKTGIEIISDERQRQLDEEGWTPEHDSQHSDGELAIASACYAMAERERDIEEFGINGGPLIFWPWDDKWWKPTPNDRIRELAKSGALIAAEIDRIQNNIK